MKYIIFTDLDGTLLDHHTYSFEKAKEALVFTKENKIPVIICTSKTQAEIEVYREKMNNNDPFIPENGGAVIIPKNYFKSLLDKEKNRYIIVELGTPYYIITNVLNELKKITGATIRGFSDLTPEEISTLTGIDTDSAKRAKKRSYSEPIIIEGSSEVVRDIKKRYLHWG
jgi:mannosyl-3-phosphoglycerate phosphatase